ncbi:MAG: hypothetical protein ABIF87_06885 [Pseudomonadota bacterium]
MSVSKVRKFLYVVGAFCILLSGCTFIDTAIEKASEVAGEIVGESVGKSLGKASLRGISPAMRQIYVSSVFNAFFYGGGYQFDYHEYKPGEWTKWEVTGMDEGDEFEKAFLKKDDKGREWWRIYTSNVTEGEAEEVVLEALFSEPDKSGGRKLLRMRGIFPGDKEPGEIPVQENTSAWYREPVQLTDESMKAAEKGMETIATPAGKFKTRHLVYKTIDGRYDWWLSDKVPGGMVKYSITYGEGGNGGEKDAYTSQIVAYGSGAKSRLGSF